LVGRLTKNLCPVQLTEQGKPLINHAWVIRWKRTEIIAESRPAPWWVITARFKNSSGNREPFFIAFPWITPMPYIHEERHSSFPVTGEALPPGAVMKSDGLFRI